MSDGAYIGAPTRAPFHSVVAPLAPADAAPFAAGWGLGETVAMPVGVLP